jgi:hypothetical protein
MRLVVSLVVWPPPTSHSSAQPGFQAPRISSAVVPNRARSAELLFSNPDTHKHTPEPQYRVHSDNAIGVLWAQVAPRRGVPMIASWMPDEAELHLWW